MVTANTGGQLKTKTWAELEVEDPLYCGELVRSDGHGVFSPSERYELSWRADAISWSSHNTEAFAGLHNQGNRIVVIFDEASAIDDTIWEVTEGALTDSNTEILWFVFGNPTKHRPLPGVLSKVPPSLEAL